MHHKALIPPPSACLLLADGTVFFGEHFGAGVEAIGEICFNTAMTGYQEVLTDPSYSGQIIAFTFPHIGNVGCNAEDMESTGVHASGLIVREPITAPSNFRSEQDLNDWLKARNISGISGVDTRALTRHIRTHGAQNAVIAPLREGNGASEMETLHEKLAAHPSMKGQDLASIVSTPKPYEWNEKLWNLRSSSDVSAEALAKVEAVAHQTAQTTNHHVVAIDYGVKHNILRNLASSGCRVTVVPATTGAEGILALKPDGIFLSNGPGDPAATGAHALPVIRALMESGVPIFGICLGHQLLGLAFGARTEKMAQGHRGANHPVKNLATGEVSITSQNHGFVVSDEALPAEVEVTHRSLFDGTIQGLRHKTKPIFCVQGHPEASPGPHDSQPLFNQFVELMRARAA